VCRKAWKFESSPGHHFYPDTNRIKRPADVVGNVMGVLTAKTPATRPR
jgi:hypothetical protein